MSHCHCPSEIIRDGSGQLDRYLKALDPSYAPIDNRSIEDLLVFAKRYAAQIRFYDTPESQVQDDTEPTKVSWREFFRRDIAVIASSIAVVDLKQIKKDYDEIRQKLELAPEQELFAALFEPILGIVARIDRWYSVALPDNPLRADLDLAIQSYLKEKVKTIIAYEKGYDVVDYKNPLKLDYTAIENDELWGVNASVDQDASIYQGTLLGDKIYHASLFVDDIFHSFYAFLCELVEKSEGYLTYALEKYPTHQPHMALFITFLQLFRMAQEQLNGVTERLLNFYYREVLHLEEKPSVPDRAHIVFELAKDVVEYAVLKETPFTAGKDLSGKDQVYKTETDLVVNQAKVKELKTIFIAKTPADALQETKVIEGIYARPIANSEDGFGEKFTSASPRWPTFGNTGAWRTKTQNICDKINQVTERLKAPTEAQIGFAIASPQLLLQEGQRLVQLQLNGLSTLFQSVPSNEPAIEIWLSGEKSWVKVTKQMTADDVTDLNYTLQTGLFLEKQGEESLFTIQYQASGDVISFILPASEQPIVAYDPKLHTGYNFNTSQPVLLINLGSTLSIKSSDFHHATISNLSLRTKVGSITPSKELAEELKKNGVSLPAPTTHFDGLKTLVIQNDNGILASNKSFDPYTAYPAEGKSFYVGSHEVFNKDLTSLAVNIKKTLDRRTPLPAPEITLSAAASSLPEFGVNILTNRNWDRLFPEFSSNFTQLSLSADILYHQGADYKNIPFDYSHRLALLDPLTEWSPSASKGFIEIVNLRPISASQGESFLQASQNAAPYFEVKEISVSYDSLLTALVPGVDQFFHAYPFGSTEIGDYQMPKIDSPKNNLSVNSSIKSLSRLKKEGDPLIVYTNRLLPHFTFLSYYERYTTKTTSTVPSTQKEDAVVKAARKTDQVIDNIILSASGITDKLVGGNNQYSNSFQEEGILFIGLENLKPLQSLSLLFQFAEGSAEDEDNDPPTIHWSYLTNNEWRPLREEYVISDGTYGFQTTGIVKFDIPEDATVHNTIITDGLLWLSASVTENSHRVPQLIDVVAQAAEVKFEDQNNALSHFDAALPAGSIKKLVTPVAEISKVNQPFNSYDGKHTEIGREFYARVSERLRHKARAINAWDYEHLVLDRFPSIYKVKLITHTDPNCICRNSTTSVRNPNGQDQVEDHCCGPQIAPGHVLVVPIPNLKNRNAVNPLQPKTSRRTLLEIEEYLKKRTSPFVHVHAKNPIYEQVIVYFKVKFHQGTDKGFYIKKLNEEIVKYLTPWAFDENANIEFGHKVYASAIINFIEDRPYVDFITDFLMGICRDLCCESGTDSREEDSEDNGLGNIKNCDDMEYLLQEQADFVGEVIVKPSKSRSLLVSAPQHVIIPYEEPVLPTPCEVIKSRRTS